MNMPVKIKKTNDSTSYSFNAEKESWESGYQRYNLKPAFQSLNLLSYWEALKTTFGDLPLDPYDKYGTRFRRFGRAIYYPWKGTIEWVPEKTNLDSEDMSPYFQGYHNPEHVGAWR